jgi:hypothetical protein
MLPARERPEDRVPRPERVHGVLDRAGADPAGPVVRGDEVRGDPRRGQGRGRPVPLPEVVVADIQPRLRAVHHRRLVHLVQRRPDRRVVGVDVPTRIVRRGEEALTLQRRRRPQLVGDLGDGRPRIHLRHRAVGQATLVDVALRHPELPQRRPGLRDPRRPEVVAGQRRVPLRRGVVAGVPPRRDRITVEVGQHARCGTAGQDQHMHVPAGVNVVDDVDTHGQDLVVRVRAHEQSRPGHVATPRMYARRGALAAAGELLGDGADDGQRPRDAFMWRLCVGRSPCVSARPGDENVRRPTCTAADQAPTSPCRVSHQTPSRRVRRPRNRRVHPDRRQHPAAVDTAIR